MSSSRSPSALTVFTVHVQQASTGAFVKPEPMEAEMPARPLNRSNSVSKPPGSPSKVKPEPSDRSEVVRWFASHPCHYLIHIQPVPTPPASPRKGLMKTDSFAELKMRPRPSADFRAAADSFEKHATAEEIDYTPEKALHAGLSMVKLIDKSVKRLELGSKMRKDVWLREIARWVNHHRALFERQLTRCGLASRPRAHLRL